MDFARDYFNAERSAAVVFIAVSVVSIMLTVFFWLGVKKPFYNGMGYPLLLLGLIELAVGTTLFWRTPADLDRVQNHFTLEPGRIKADEIPRMTAVMKNFKIIRYAEITFIAVALIIMFYPSSSPFMRGIGIALFMQSAVLLSADYLAERRAEQYLHELDVYATSLEMRAS